MDVFYLCIIQEEKSLFNLHCFLYLQIILRVFILSQYLGTQSTLFSRFSCCRAHVTIRASWLTSFTRKCDISETSQRANVCLMSVLKIKFFLLAEHLSEEGRNGVGFSPLFPTLCCWTHTKPHSSHIDMSCVFFQLNSENLIFGSRFQIHLRRKLQNYFS